MNMRYTMENGHFANISQNQSKDEQNVVVLNQNERHVNEHDVVQRSEQ